jgi:hypothetical protein
MSGQHSNTVPVCADASSASARNHSFTHPMVAVAGTACMLQTNALRIHMQRNTAVQAPTAPTPQKPNPPSLPSSYSTPSMLLQQPKPTKPTKMASMLLQQPKPTKPTKMASMLLP